MLSPHAQALLQLREWHLFRPRWVPLRGPLPGAPASWVRMTATRSTKAKGKGSFFLFLNSYHLQQYGEYCAKCNKPVSEDKDPMV